MKLVTNILLFFTSIFLGAWLLILTLFQAIIDSIRYGSFYRRINHYFLSGAVAIDIACNTVFAPFLNAWFLRRGGYHFGKKGETISSSLGKNQCVNGLTYMGVGLASVLDMIQKDHCWISIDEDVYYTTYAPPKRVKRSNTFIVLIITLLLLYFLFKIYSFLI